MATAKDKNQNNKEKETQKSTEKKPASSKKTTTKSKSSKKSASTTKKKAAAKKKTSKKKTTKATQAEPKQAIPKTTTKDVMKIKDPANAPVPEKLGALSRLQTVDSEIDKIKILRGELPLEVQDLEDELAGLNTRMGKQKEEIKELEKNISDKKNEIKEAETLIKKYEAQQANVRNNREYDSLSKEIEYQSLEIQLCEKRIKEYTDEINLRKEQIETANVKLEERKNDLEHKKQELDNIIKETQKEEEDLIKESKEIETKIEPRLLSAYKRIRKNARNGLAVVPVERDACGGCFNKIPPQRQLDIKSRKKIIVCEYCGRILVDEEL